MVVSRLIRRAATVAVAVGFAFPLYWVVVA